MPDNLGKRLVGQVFPRTSEFVHFPQLGIRRCNEARRNSDLIGAGPCGTNPVINVWQFSIEYAVVLGSREQLLRIAIIGFTE